MKTCETCRFWMADGQRSAPSIRFIKSEQIWKRPCVRFPQDVQKWFDDWCGEYQTKSQPDRTPKDPAP